MNKERRVIETAGNGRLDAVSNAIKLYFSLTYKQHIYEEHAVSKGSSSRISIKAPVSAAYKLAASQNVM